MTERSDLTPGTRYRFGYRRIVNKPTAVHQFDATVRGFDGDQVLVEMSDRASTGRSNERLYLTRIAFADELVTGRRDHLASEVDSIEHDTSTTEQFRSFLQQAKEANRRG